MDIALQKSLVQMGLSEKQAQVLLALLELEQGTASQIAVKAELKRPVTYVIIEDLIRLGYIKEVPGKSIRNFTPVDPIRIYKTAQANLADFKFMLPLLRSMYKAGESKPHIEYYEGRQGVLSVFHSFNHAKRSRYVSNYELLKQYFPKQIESWIQSAVSGKTKTDTRQLVVNNSAGQDFAQRVVQDNDVWQVRTLPKDTDWQMDLSIVDDVLAYVSFDPMFVLVVNSPIITKTMANFFDLTWQSAKPVIR